MLVGGTQIKAQAFKFANEMKIEDFLLEFSDSDDQVFISIHTYKTKSRNFKSHGLKAVGCLEKQMRAQ